MYCPYVKFKDELNGGDPELPKPISEFRIEYPPQVKSNMTIVNLAAATYIKNGSDTTEYITVNIEETRKEMKFAHFLPMDQAERCFSFILEATGRLRRCAQAFLEEIARM